MYISMLCLCNSGHQNTDGPTSSNQLPYYLYDLICSYTSSPITHDVSTFKCVFLKCTCDLLVWFDSDSKKQVLNFPMMETCHRVPCCILSIANFEAVISLQLKLCGHAVTAWLLQRYNLQNNSTQTWQYWHELSRAVSTRWII